jgi:hypothetical protein
MYKYIYLLIALAAFTTHQSFAQGCVAIRQISNVSNSMGQGSFMEKGEWNFSTSYRYFKSFRHFRGLEEEPDRVAQNTQVINWTHQIDVNISYAFTDRFFGTVSLPYADNARSSLYEHGRQSRHSSYSSGITDLIVSGGYWLFSGEKTTKGNMAVGFGIKMPTGNYKSTSTFYNVGTNGASELRPVDQSIQLGDGGWGLPISVQGIWSVAPSLFLYYDGFYLLNPQNTNGVKTFRRRASESIMSVTDQFALRAGIFKPIEKIHGLSFNLGGRIEGVPVRDVMGKSDGFRRPGYVVSIEPGVSYMLNNFTIGANLPIALVRNRTRSLTDIADSTPDNRVHGDAAFADYLININLAWRIPKKVKGVFNSID